jgi:hypothetical protein
MVPIRIRTVLMTIGTVFYLQYVTPAIAIFSDKRPRLGFPRRATYLALWVSLSFLPATGAMFLKTGPLAWNGLLVWWIPFAMFTGWFVLVITLTWRAVRQITQPIEID